MPTIQLFTANMVIPIWCLKKTALQHKTEIKYKDLPWARFANGVLTIKGDLYYPAAIPEEVDLNSAIVKGMSCQPANLWLITSPYHGVNGIAILAKKLIKLSRKMNRNF
ncbi:MAG: DUF4872 domain-containing protein [Draconibacterium sp.]|nr:DUF4872 domain-containing protein [Draconibacterium sp.]